MAFRAIRSLGVRVTGWVARCGVAGGGWWWLVVAGDGWWMLGVTGFGWWWLVTGDEWLVVAGGGQ